MILAPGRHSSVNPMFVPHLAQNSRSSQRPRGVDLQVHCAVIACLLINLQTGKKPGKLMTRMLGWYLLGIATEQEVINFLNRPDNTGVKRRAKDALWKKLGVN